MPPLAWGGLILTTGPSRWVVGRRHDYDRIPTLDRPIDLVSRASCKNSPSTTSLAPRSRALTRAAHNAQRRSPIGLERSKSGRT